MAIAKSANLSLNLKKHCQPLGEKKNVELRRRIGGDKSTCVLGRRNTLRGLNVQKSTEHNTILLNLYVCKLGTLTRGSASEPRVKITKTAVLKHQEVQ